MKRKRNLTKQINAGGLLIGGDAPLSVQSMTNVPIEDVKRTIEQINSLQNRGANLVRLALLTVDSAGYLKEVLENTDIPLCADIHFDYRIALKAIDAGIHKIRINPGNIGDRDRTRDVVKAAKERGIPIRIGVNGGSIDRKKYKEVTPEALVDSALHHIQILEDLDFTDIAVSIKSSDLFQTIEANKLMAQKRGYPIHVGLTEAGYGEACLVQSSIAIGHLLLSGIGDTIRVSMTGDPLREIDAGYEILRAIGDVNHGIKIVSCPTCGRTDPTIDLEDIARRIDSALNERYAERLKSLNRLITVAIMGCEVNGPGEASHADVGIAGARSGSFLLFAKGERIKKVHESEVLSSVIEEVDKLFD